MLNCFSDFGCKSAFKYNDVLSCSVRLLLTYYVVFGKFYINAVNVNSCFLKGLIYNITQIRRSFIYNIKSCIYNPLVFIYLFNT